MAKYVSEERLRKLIENDDYYDSGIEKAVIYGLIDNECEELNPWMTLDEFLKSGFIGLCWIEFPSEIITDAYFDGHLFKHSSTSDFVHNENYITRVQPIHKPEPPQDD